MDPKQFYRDIHTTPNYPNVSTDDDLFDDDLFAPETSEESDAEENIPPPQFPGGWWRDGYLEKNEADLEFSGDTSLPAHIMELTTPLQFFKYLFTDDMFQHVTQKTLRYATEKRPEKPMTVTEKEIEQFVGICLMMSIIKLPGPRDYWSPVLGHPKVSSIMSFNRFDDIKRYINFNENSTQVPKGQPDYDPVHKIRPLLNQIRERLSTVPREQYMAIDEQIIPTISMSSMKPYNSKTPQKFQYKTVVLRGNSGFNYDFELHTSEYVHETLAEDLPHLSTSSNIVVRLARTIPENLNYSLFFDKQYTSLLLLVHLSKKGILPLGTIKANRIPGYKVLLENDFKKKGRGAIVEKLTTIDRTDISVITWYDKRVVSVASTYVGSQSMTEVRHYNKKEKVYESVPCPKAVTTYKNHTSRVNLLDLGDYRIQIKSKKIYHLILFHLIDMTTVNAWLLYRRRNDNASVCLPLSDFKAAVAEGLTIANKPSTSITSRRSSSFLEHEIKQKRARGTIAIMPSKDVRLDQMEHLPVWSSRQRCKLPDCTSRSFVECNKCKVSLCLNDKRNCFLLFHTI